MPNDLVPEFVHLPSDEFTMGANDGEEDERPAHLVFLDSFSISIHTVTNRHYAAFVSQSPSFATYRDHPALAGVLRATQYQ